MTNPTELVHQFMAAERAHELLRRQWNALPSSEARFASGISFTEVDNARDEAARRLVAAVGNLHHIEQQSRVWLKLVDGKWQLDMSDDDPFEGYEEGALNDACECCEELTGDEAEQMRAECEAVREAVDLVVPLPDADALRAVLNPPQVIDLVHNGYFG